ncbi:hypothetical protein ACA910_002626 [Epithemia clementina (nom. ined.)]
MSAVDTAFANQALALSVQHWMDLGRGQDPVTGTPDNIEEAAVRITNMFLIRIIALYHCDQLEDLSTSTIAVAVLDSPESAIQLTKQITPSLTLQLETYVTCMLYGYVNDLPFHNYQHAYHVCVSANKFMESMLLSYTRSNNHKNNNNHNKPRDIFGLNSSPLSLMALIFAALIHDVGHTGVSNFQRAQDDPALAEKHQDSSLHEHHSLHIAFDELLKDEYSELRQVMFKEPSHYETFRSLVYDAVLSTDIANPGRAEEAKLKYFAAFPKAGCDEEAVETENNRRSSISSNISMPRVSTKQNRRASGQTVSSVNSDITMDSYSMMKHQNKVTRNTALTLQSWRAATGSNHSVTPNRRVARRHSIETLSSTFSEFAADSIRMTREKPTETTRRSSIGGGLTRRSSLGEGGARTQQRRLSASHSADTGLIGMAHELRRHASTSDVYGKKSRSKRSCNKNSSKRSDSLELVGSGVGRDKEGEDPDDYDGDSSLSLTPPSSDDEFDGVVITGITGVKHSPGQLPKKNGVDIEATELLGPPMALRDNRRMTRRASNGGTPAKFGSIQEESAQNMNYSNGNFAARDFNDVVANVADDLRAAVVIELLLRASDVAHWYQSWDTMTHYNRRIFQELCKASNDGRGFDPRPNWFDNQAKIMETYLLPLAEQIEYLGVLRKGSGIDLVASLESNNDLWLVRGFDVVEALKSESK